MERLIFIKKLICSDFTSEDEANCDTSFSICSGDIPVPLSVKLIFKYFYLKNAN